MHKQTSIIGTESVDIRTERNTHVEGAVIAAENNNLKLDTSTLTHKDIYDHDTGSNTQVSVSAPLSVPGAKDGKQDDSSALAKVLGASTASASHDSHDRQQVNRATIGEGTIIIRSDPKQGLEGLNRDLKKAQELTKDSQTSVKVYIDPAAIKAIKETGEKILEEAQKARADAKTQERLQNAKLPDDLRSLEDKNGLTVMKNLIAASADDATILKVMRNEGFQKALAMAADVDNELGQRSISIDYGSQWASTTEEGNNGNRLSINISWTLGDRLAEALYQAKLVYDSIPNKEEAALALLGLQVAFSGPLRVAWEIGKTALVEMAAGQEVEKAKQTLAVGLATILKNGDYSSYVDPQKLAEAGEATKAVMEGSRFGVDLLAGTAGVLVAGVIETKAGQVLTKATFADPKLLLGHFEKHGAEFGVTSVAEYEKLASDFMTKPKPQGVLEKIRPSDGATVRYNPTTEEFGILSNEGVLRTYFKPSASVHKYKNNMEYFNAQR